MRMPMITTQQLVQTSSHKTQQHLTPTTVTNTKPTWRKLYNLRATIAASTLKGKQPVSKLQSCLLCCCLGFVACRNALAHRLVPVPVRLHAVSTAQPSSPAARAHAVLASNQLQLTHILHCAAACVTAAAAAAARAAAVVEDKG
jgi:hypothetical protein